MFSDNFLSSALNSVTGFEISRKIGFGYVKISSFAIALIYILTSQPQQEKNRD